MKAWLPQVGICLLLQACIATTGVVLQQWIVAPGVKTDAQLLL